MVPKRGGMAYGPLSFNQHQTSNNQPAINIKRDKAGVAKVELGPYRRASVRQRIRQQRKANRSAADSKYLVAVASPEKQIGIIWQK